MGFSGLRGNPHFKNVRRLSQWHTWSFRYKISTYNIFAIPTSYFLEWSVLVLGTLSTFVYLWVWVHKIHYPCVWWANRIKIWSYFHHSQTPDLDHLTYCKFPLVICSFLHTAILGASNRESELSTDKEGGFSLVKLVLSVSVFFFLGQYLHSLVSICSFKIHKVRTHHSPSSRISSGQNPEEMFSKKRVNVWAEKQRELCYQYPIDP